jgi:hypothetical protein
MPALGDGMSKTANTKTFRLRRWEQIVILLLVLGVGWAIWEWNSGRDLGAEYQQQLRLGVPRLTGIQTVPDGGNAHIADPAYATEFPTTGPHEPTWIKPGFHSRPQAPGKLVHSLEHGMIVIYYDAPGDQALGILRGWANLFPGQWSGVVVTRKPGLGGAIVLSAWRNLLRQDVFDPAVAAAFIDRFRGRGPENPVR